LLAAALNEKVTVTENGKRRQITKREAVIAQLVNKSAAAELRATKMPIDILHDIEKKAEPPAAAKSPFNDAAIDGQGIALARTALAAADLINGRLTRPFQTALSLKNTYWIVCPRATSALPKIVKFRDWLLAEAAADAQQLDRIRVKRASARIEDPALVA
jgi:hypothetical protein